MIYYAHRWQVRYLKKTPHGCLVSAPSCCGHSWEDSNADSKRVLISEARSHLEDCSCTCPHLGWDLKTRAAHPWPFHVSWLPPSMAAPGGLVPYKTRSTSIPENEAEVHGLIWVLVSHLLPFIGNKQVTSLPRIKGRSWLQLFMGMWQGSRGWETGAANFEGYY